MRIEVARNSLARLLQQVSKAIESRNTIPILACVRLVNQDGRLTATASDLDVEISGGIPSPGDDASFCVNAKLITDVVVKMSGDDVLLDVKDGIVTVSSGRSRFKLQTLDATDFPTISTGEFGAAFDLDVADLLAPVQFAMSTEETRYYLNGVYFSGVAGTITAVATDGHRLSRNRVDDQPVDFAGVILPRKLVSLLPKGVVRIELSDAQIRITSGESVVVSKLVDGTYPDYERVIPTSNDRLISVNRDVIMRAAELMSIVSSERGRAVKFTFAGGLAALSVRSDGDEGSEEIPVDFSGEPIEIGFNSKYVSEVFSVFPPGEVIVALRDSGSPALLTSAAVPGQCAVIMPMRV